jgi:hypothetical protein
MHDDIGVDEHPGQTAELDISPNDAAHFPARFAKPPNQMLADESVCSGDGDDHFRK